MYPTHVLGHPATKDGENANRIPLRLSTKHGNCLCLPGRTGWALAARTATACRRRPVAGLPVFHGDDRWTPWFARAEVPFLHAIKHANAWADDHGNQLELWHVLEDGVMSREGKRVGNCRGREPTVPVVVEGLATFATLTPKLRRPTSTTTPRTIPAGHPSHPEDRRPLMGLLPRASAYLFGVPPDSGRRVFCLSTRGPLRPFAQVGTIAKVLNHPRWS